MIRVDILVVGGGVIGLTAALAMSQRGFSVALVDEGNFDNKENNRVYAINAASAKLFTKLGVWQQIPANEISPYTRMEVWDAKSGAEINFDARLKAVTHLGAILEEPKIKQALLLSIKQQENISLYPNSRVNQVKKKADGIAIHSADNQWHAQLLLIADGAQSPTRGALKVPLTTWSYKQNAIVATVQTEEPHQKSCYQVFQPDGPLAFLPLVDAHTCSIVWTTTPEKAAQLVTLPEEDFNTELTKTFARRLGKVKVISQRYQFPLAMRHAQQYAGKHWILLGDAAHTIHPLAGLGLNLGLADIQTWLNCLDMYGNDLNSTTAMGKYQRQRKAANWQVIALMQGLKTLFGSTFSPIIVLRSLGLRAFDSITPLKRLLISEAMGEK